MNSHPSQRERLMAALSAAENLVAQSPAEPYTVDITHHSAFPADAVGVQIFFRQDPGGVREFAAVMGVEPVEMASEFGGRPLVDTVASGDLDGVPYLAWTRAYKAAEVPALDTAPASGVAA
ncbi:hypothetical protein [Streptomyces sp. RKAG337]|uniref:hypothetical protein n=1 Tax=Streptomyces sp. RKAG337 TaxID=2893404 RepID=UPI00203397BA|nr:hypothetical protein [Streptomyces sp. RKAG337]MCM2427349.1 hypothetical protein [Streptomyces sp. RKAG337]